jgi:hypothetical protein
MLGPRNNFLFITSLVTIALGGVAIFTASWVPLAIGTAVLLVTHAVPGKTVSSRA